MGKPSSLNPPVSELDPKTLLTPCNTASKRVLENAISLHLTTFPVMPHVVSWPPGPPSGSKLAANSNWPSGKRTESAVKNSESGGRSTPKRCVKKSENESCSVISYSETPWTILSMECSRPEYWSSLSLLQGIFPNQRSNLGLPHCRRILYQQYWDG